jgi:hypothetical protein
LAEDLAVGCLGEHLEEGAAAQRPGFFDMYAYILTECEAYAKLYGLQAPEPDLSEPKPKEPAISIKDAAMLLQGKDPSLS